MEVFSERVRSLAAARHLNASSLGKELGASSSSAALYWSGKRPWPTEVIPQLASKLGTTIDYLFGRTDDSGVLDFHGSPSDFDAFAEIWSSSKTADFQSSMAQQGLIMIPEVDHVYSMGGGSIAPSHYDERFVPFRIDWLDRLLKGFKADVFLTRGQGDSMMPTILDDDVVLVNRADNVPQQQDRIWALGYGELGMIKRVRRMPDGQWQLNSDNTSVSPVIATDDEVEFIGRVIWIGRAI